MSKQLIIIKKEIDKLTQKKIRLDSNNNSKEYTIELVKKLDCTEKNVIKDILILVPKKKLINTI